MTQDEAVRFHDLRYRADQVSHHVLSDLWRMCEAYAEMAKLKPDDQRVRRRAERFQGIHCAVALMLEAERQAYYADRD